MRIDEALDLAVRQRGRSGYFFDFDGTLATIQLDPQTVWPLPGTADSLAQLTRLADVVAIVSARPVEFLASRFANVSGLRLYGLYGLEQMMVGEEAATHPDVLPWVPVVAEVVAAARTALPDDVGVEDKRLSVALHYRSAPERQTMVEEWATEQAAKHGLTAQPGRMVVELKPPIDVSKGTVLADAMTGLNNVWYFGDDVADLAAFAALDDRVDRDAGFRAVRVAIKHRELDTRLAEAADLLLDSPSALADFVKDLVNKLVTRLTPASRSPDILAATRASDGDRDVIAERLRDAFTDGRLDEDEFDARMHAALTARTIQDLERLLDDLGPTPTPPYLPAPAPGREVARQEHHWTVALMGANERKGRWRVPETTRSVAIMGGTLLDLRTASFRSPVTTIWAVAVMGAVDVVVPPGVRVEVSGFGLMGGLDDRVADEDLPATTPVVRVKWFACMGGVSVRTKHPRSKRRGADGKGADN